MFGWIWWYLMDDWSFFRSLGKIIFDFLNTFLLVALLLGFIDCIDPEYSSNCVTSLEEVGSFFVNGHQILQKELGWGRIFRQLQVYLNPLAENLEEAFKNRFAVEIVNVNQPKDKWRPWSLSELGPLSLQHLLDWFKPFLIPETVVEISNEWLVSVVVVVLPFFRRPAWAQHLCMIRLILCGGKLRLFSQFFSLLFSLGWTITFFTLYGRPQEFLDS